MGKRLIALLVAVSAIALASSGCGGGSSGSSSGGDSSSSSSSTAANVDPPSKAEFISQTDAICTQGGKQVEVEYAAYLKKNHITKATEEKESEAETEARVADIIKTIGIPVYKQQAKEIAALAVPSGDEAAVEAYLDAVDKGIEKSEGEPQAVFEGTSKAFDKADKIAQEFGFKVCGSNRSG